MRVGNKHRSQSGRYPGGRKDPNKVRGEGEAKGEEPRGREGRVAGRGGVEIRSRGETTKGKRQRQQETHRYPGPCTRLPEAEGQRRGEEARQPNRRKGERKKRGEMALSPHHGGARCRGVARVLPLVKTQNLLMTTYRCTHTHTCISCLPYLLLLMCESHCLGHRLRKRLRPWLGARRTVVRLEPGRFNVSATIPLHALKSAHQRSPVEWLLRFVLKPQLRQSHSVLSC